VDQFEKPEENVESLTMMRRVADHTEYMATRTRTLTEVLCGTNNSRKIVTKARVERRPKRWEQI
jgi:hypothetical protein